MFLNKIFSVALLVFFLTLNACAHKNQQKEKLQQDEQKIKTELDPEVSLKADREYLKEARKEIPQEKQKANDELALYLNMMGQGTEQPQTVRDKFTELVEKKRAAFRDKVQHLRDNYRREETHRREDFLAEQSDKRKSFDKSRHFPQQISDFKSKQDRDRREFMDDERDRRTHFEAELSAESKDFNSYMKEKLNEFNERYRLYAKKYSERPKEGKAVTGESGDSGAASGAGVSGEPTRLQPLGTDDN